MTFHARTYRCLKCGQTGSASDVWEHLRSHNRPRNKGLLDLAEEVKTIGVGP